MSHRRSQQQNLQMLKITALSLQVRSHRAIVLTVKASFSFIIFSSIFRIRLERLRIYTKPLHIMQSLFLLFCLFLRFVFISWLLCLTTVDCLLSHGFMLFPRARL